MPGRVDAVAGAHGAGGGQDQEAPVFAQEQLSLRNGKALIRGEPLLEAGRKTVVEQRGRAENVRLADAVHAVLHVALPWSCRRWKNPRWDLLPLFQDRRVSKVSARRAVVLGMVRDRSGPGHKAALMVKFLRPGRGL